MGGKPTIKGTRITVELIREEIADSMTLDEMGQAHPHLEQSDIRAALGLAVAYLRREEINFSEPATAI